MRTQALGQKLLVIGVILAMERVNWWFEKTNIRVTRGFELTSDFYREVLGKAQGTAANSSRQ